MEDLKQDYTGIIEERAGEVFAEMRPRVSDEDMLRLHDAFEMAREAHKNQKRKTGEPYILHPIAVAMIAASELCLDANSVIAAFLHDVVEDTDITVDQIQKRFGSDVSFLVKVLTKVKKEKYEMSKQLDNFKQILSAIQYDIRPVLVKLADRLHNMRTLSSMRPDKQMKIAGETDYFYAPLATRLGLYEVKTELENLSLRFRVPHEFEKIRDKILMDQAANNDRLESFRIQMESILEKAGIKATINYYYRQPYSLWRKMSKYGEDFDHLRYRHFFEIVFSQPEDVKEKEMILRIYSILTERFREKPGGITSYVDTPKENGYQSFHLKLLADYGMWEEVHISSERMVRNSRTGSLDRHPVENIRKWIAKFRNNLKAISRQTDKNDGEGFIENVVASFYNDDIMTFSPKGKPVVLPQRATAIDFAYEIHTALGNNAKYARINGRLASIKTPLRRGDIIQIYADPDSHPQQDWLDHVVSFKARKAITQYLDAQSKPEYGYCPECCAIPGDEVIGFRDPASGEITVHKRDCPVAVRLVSQYGDNIVPVDFKPDRTLYPVKFDIICIDRAHMIIDIVECISNKLNLSINTFNTKSVDSIVTLSITMGVHSYGELQTIIAHIREIPDVDEVQVETLPVKG